VQTAAEIPSFLTDTLGHNWSNCNNSNTSQK